MDQPELLEPIQPIARTSLDVYGPDASRAPSPWAAIRSPLLGAVFVPVAGLIRISTEDLQNPRASALRQIANCTRRLPSGWQIVVWFIDVESGRMVLEDRGQRPTIELAHLDLPVPRAGGLAELLAEAARKNRRFEAVIVENSERLARVTYINTRIEHDLSQVDVELIAADEPIDTGGKMATRILTRRMKQSIAEFYAINVMEQAWDGFVVHTKSGYNVGRVPYGYAAERIKHPSPARAALGGSKTRLILDPICGPIVTMIFDWRVRERLTYWAITERLNDDLDRYPPPIPVPATSTERRWHRSTVRAILHNPKYTGYMVWNRTTTRTGLTLRAKQHTRSLPADQWVWSDEPTHPALVDLGTFRIAQADDAAGAEGSRSKPTTTPSESRTYTLRSYIRCPYCPRRMNGTYSGGLVYYTCRGPRDDKGRRITTDVEHPPSVYLREEAILPQILTVIGQRVFGPDRHELMAAQLASAPTLKAEQNKAALAAAERHLTQIETRQSSLLNELETTGPEHHAWRARLRDRYTELETERQSTSRRVNELMTATPVVEDANLALLDAMPLAATRLNQLNQDQLRRLLDSLHLEVRMLTPKAGILRMTLTSQSPETANGALTQPDGSQGMMPPPNADARTPDQIDLGYARHVPIAAFSVQDQPAARSAATSCLTTSSGFVRIRNAGKRRMRSPLTQTSFCRRRSAAQACGSRCCAPSISTCSRYSAKYASR
jgi:site-specific DNA recombinase